jgi:hypothetical protein
MTRASTRAERRDQVTHLLIADAAQSNRAVARAAGVSHATVAAVRAELILSGQIDRQTDRPEVVKQSTTGQNANLLREDGRGIATTHGAYSARALSGRVDELTDELRGVVPGAEAADDTVIRLLALLLAQIEAANAWVAERGLFKRAGKGEPQPILTMQARWITAAAKLCDQLGLTPSSRVRLGVVAAGDDAYAHYLEITNKQRSDRD